MKYSELKKRLNELEFNIPKEYFFEEKNNGIRVASKTLMNVKVKGARGIMVYNGELTHAFVLNFGKYSSKRVYLDDKQFSLGAEGKNFDIAGEDGDYIAFYTSFPVFLVKIKNGKAHPLVGKGFKRKLKSFLKNKE